MKMEERNQVPAVNKFLQPDDYELVSFRCLRKELEHIYRDVMKKSPDTYGAKDPRSVVIHWARAWEYPWAIINSRVRAGEKVLDCGCGGSPLLPFLAGFGCQAYGVDPFIRQRTITYLDYYPDQFKRMLFRVLNLVRPAPPERSPLESSLTAQMRQAYEKTIAVERQRGDGQGRPGGAGMLARALSVPRLLFSRLRKPDDLWHFRQDPNRWDFGIRYFNESLTRMHFPDGFFDRVFCISVIEHLSEEDALRGMREMARVLKKGGLLAVTVDHDGEHVTPQLRGAYRELINASGLKLHGPADFAIPDIEDVPGECHVVGFVLEK